MSIFWPEGLSVSDVRSPYEILENAQEEWETASDGVLTLVLQKSESEDGIEIITVHAKHIPSNRTITLLSVTHRLNEPYPASIQPREQDTLPNILKKSYYQHNPNYFRNDLDRFPPQFEDEDKEGWTVTNKWVSDTPSEFRNKLVNAFNLSEVKAAILNLTSSKGTS